MISFKQGDMLAAPGIPVIPVNCVGVMGKGLALAAKKKWLWVFEGYKEACRGYDDPDMVLVPGACLWESNGTETICLLTTKDHWRDPSRQEWIEDGIRQLARSSWESAVFNVPKLGCGLGGLDWNDVRPLMVKYFTDAPGMFIVWE